MSDLAPAALNQAARDADSKRVIEGGRAQTVLAWFFSRSWKLQFLLAALLMFLGYAAVATLLEWTGLRPPLDGPAACARDLPLEALAVCVSRPRKNSR